jgi:toxin ParE1/3/4
MTQRRLPLRLEFTPLAIQDLGDIWLYHAESRGPDIADEIVEDLSDRIDILRTNPLIGPRRHEIADGLRMLVVGNYLAFYMVRSTTINVVRILHGARDIKTIMGPSES